MSRFTTRIWTAWHQYWFAPEAPEPLGLCRILFFGGLFLFYLPHDFALWGTVSDVFWMPIPVLGLFEMPVFSAATLNVLQIVWKGALLLSCIGLFTRMSTATAFTLGFYLLGLQHNWGKVYHTDALIVFALAAMMVARCSDVLSVDGWWTRRNGTPRPTPSGEYRWPIRTVWLLFALVFFAAGFAKLATSGLAWVFSDNMATTLLKQQYGGNALLDWGFFIARYPLLCQLLAGGTLLLEIGYPLALFSRRARWVFVPGMLMALVGIRLLMGPTFIEFMIAYVFWVPWGAIIPTSDVERPAAAAPERVGQPV